MGESRRKEEYLCFPEHLCTCYSFFYDIVGRGEQLCVSALVLHICCIFQPVVTVVVKFIDARSMSSEIVLFRTLTLYYVRPEM